MSPSLESVTKAMAEGFHQFLIMMYKGLLIRKRHYIVTIIEMIIPILIASILVITTSMSGSDSGTGSSERDATFYDPVSPFMLGYGYVDSILYTPNNTATQLLINRASDICSQYHPYARFSSQGYETEKDLENAAIIYRSGSRTVVGIVLANFHDDDSLTFPASLDYKIRFGTSSSYSLESQYFPGMRPNLYNSYESSSFTVWQASVEQAFISLKTNETNVSNDYQVFMQRFPYPPYQSDTSILVQLVSMFIMHGLVIFFCVMVKRVVAEKANHSKELLKMMGMTNSVYWSSTFLNYFLFGAVIVFILTIMFKIPVSADSFSVINRTGFGLLFFILLLYLASSILMYLMITTVFNRPNFAVCVTLLVHVLSNSLLMGLVFQFGLDSPYLALSSTQKYAICLLPNGALQAAFLLLSAFETYGKDTQTGIMSYSMYSDVTLTGIVLMMLLSCFLYSLIIWYLDAAWPWQFGVPRPLYFPFTKSYWCNSVDETVSEEEWRSNDEYIEKDPDGVKRGIAIRKLTKIYNTGAESKKKAVDNVSMNIYNGQITALLGRNGAGKTTTINILTGLFMPSSGTASINGWDIRTHTKMARSNLGICPQHNVLYDTLTVEEHLRIYAALKGVKWGQLSAEVTETLRILKLDHKYSELSKDLSGGMKRKLSLGIAIIGGSKVLFLDEPSSGMDPEARRSLWDILLSLRADRTIVLTTHYMEEADILGDRIAIMADGKIQCCGSPMFLKKKFGTGYRLHIVKNNNCDVNAITRLMQNHISQINIESPEENPTLTYSFGDSTPGTAFASLFQDLELKKDKLGISSFGITVTTMDDVFLKVSLLADEIPDDNNSRSSTALVVDSNDESLFPQYQKLNFGIELWLLQFKGLFFKRIIYARRYWSILICQLLVPFALLCGLMGILRTSNSYVDRAEKHLEMTLPSFYGKTEGVYNFVNDSSGLEGVYKSLLETNGVSASQNDDPEAFALKVGKNIHDYKTKLSVGGVGNFTESTLNVTAWYNGQQLQVLPMALNLVHTALLRFYTGNATARMTLTNSPFPSESMVFSRMDPMTIRIIAVAFIPLILSFISAGYVLLPIKECHSRAKLLQLMTGISSFTYWLSMFVWDMLIHASISLLLIIPFAIFAGTVFFAHPEAIGGVIVLFLLSGWSILPFCYLLSRVIGKPATGFILILSFMVITGLVLAVILSTLEALINEDKLNIALYFVRLMPSFASAWGFRNLFLISYDNSFCDGIPDDFLNIACQPSFRGRMDYQRCCKNLCGDNCFNMTYPFTWDREGCGRDMFYLFLDGLLLFALLLFLETNILRKAYTATIDKIPKKKNTISGIVLQDMIAGSNADDSDVVLEATRISNLNISESEALVVKQLAKYYRGFCAVDGLSFGVHKEECFGLLGVNGAGKTSTFKMLTGDIFPTSGDACISNTSAQMDLKKFQSFIGYCPQFDALIDRLTGKEMLHLFASLRGITNIDDCVSKLINSVDLQEHANKQTRFYSGGNKRKLSIAMALLGSPPVILLDEPSAGVDPVSRRKIWNILSQTRKINKSAIILCTHSMEECEALCVRLAIMVNGKFCCLGSIQHLKSKYGLGFTITIKLQREQSMNNVAVSEIRNHFERIFQGATLKDYHQGMFQFYINDASISWSYLFNSMEQMKQTFRFEDYLISGTTLEQIFLGFARRQRNTDPV